MWCARESREGGVLPLRLARCRPRGLTSAGLSARPAVNIEPRGVFARAWQRGRTGSSPRRQSLPRGAISNSAQLASAES